MKITTANKSKIIVKTGFRRYDVCINPYVGCGYGCKFCYVRFFIKDKEEWGNFIRIREHIKDNLPTELSKNIKIKIGRDNNKKPVYKYLSVPESRLVIGTMTDPFQPIEKEHKITKTILEILIDNPNKFKKVGLFTRSPNIIDDLDIITKLPNPCIHFTVSPFDDAILKLIEPNSPSINDRWNAINKLVKSGVEVHVNIAPVMPIFSDNIITDYITKLVSLKVNGYFVDPLQAYNQSFQALDKALLNNTDWDRSRNIIINNDEYNKWKDWFHNEWDKIRKTIQPDTLNQLPIWSDHINMTWVDMRSNKPLID